MSWDALPGWSDDTVRWQLAMADRIPRGGVYVEIGVFLGRSLAHIGELRPDLELWAIDPWPADYADLGEHAEYVKRYGSLWSAFLFGMREHCPEVLDRTRVMRATAQHVHLPFESADVVFIDGLHDETNVRADIVTSYVWVKRGGLFAGHDFQGDYPGVMTAVDALVPGRTVGCDEEWSSVWWEVR